MSLSDYWYVLCRAEALRQSPLSLCLLGQPVVLFRGQGAQPVALIDRCPHRNVPLSLGTVRAGNLECRYHGWRFDSGGLCVDVPGRCAQTSPAARVPRFATLEQDGYVWAWGRPDATPHEAPYRSEALGKGYRELHSQADYPAGLYASLENTIDVPHTVFLHRNLFRKRAAQRRVTCTVTRDGREVSASYLGEDRPDTWLARVLAPAGGDLRHEDRYIAPSIVRVEYQLGTRVHLLSTAFFTPVDDEHTRLHVRIAYRLGLPGDWLSPLLKLVSARVLREDIAILAAQTRNQRRFQGTSHASTELDLFAIQIEPLLQQASSGSPSDEVSQRCIEIMM